MIATATGAPPRQAGRRRAVIPVWARALMAVVVALELVGFFLRVLRAPEWISHPLSMELPFSVPRLTVAVVFAASSLVALAGAARLPRRRTWWLAVAGIAALVSVVKAGGTIHKGLVEAVDGYAHPLRTLLLFGTVAVVGLVGLFWVSRFERRDRRRVLGWLSLYAFASVGLSTLSGQLEATLGRPAVATVTAAFVEESVEGVAAVGLLVGVLLGVAPKLVLPAGTEFRRDADRGTAEPTDIAACHTTS